MLISVRAHLCHIHAMFAYQLSTDQKATSAAGHRCAQCVGLELRSKTCSRRRSYKICYLSADDRLFCKFVVRNATCAKVMAHAMKLPWYRRFEIWPGETTIYSRPNRYQTS